MLTSKFPFWRRKSRWELARESVSEHLDHLKEQAGGALHGAGETLLQAGEAVGETLVHAGETIVQTVRPAPPTLASSLVSTAREGAHTVSQAVSGAASTVASGVSSAASGAASGVSQVAQSAGSKASTAGLAVVAKGRETAVRGRDFSHDARATLLGEGEVLRESLDENSKDLFVRRGPSAAEITAGAAASLATLKKAADERREDASALLRDAVSQAPQAVADLRERAAGAAQSALESASQARESAAQAREAAAQAREAIAAKAVAHGKAALDRKARLEESARNTIAHARGSSTAEVEPISDQVAEEAKQLGESAHSWWLFGRRKAQDATEEAAEQARNMAGQAREEAMEEAAKISKHEKKARRKQEKVLAASAAALAAAEEKARRAEEEARNEARVREQREREAEEARREAEQKANEQAERDAKRVAKEAAKAAKKARKQQDAEPAPTVVEVRDVGAPEAVLVRRSDDLEAAEDDHGSGSRVPLILLGLAVGAAAVYFLAPGSGRRHRAAAVDSLDQVKEKASEAVDTVLEKTADKAEDLSHRAEDLAQDIHEAAADTAEAPKSETQDLGTSPDIAPHDDGEDRTLVDRVRSELGQVEEFKHLSLNIDSAEGIVTIRGSLPDEAARNALEAAVQAVPGVQAARIISTADHS